MKDFRRMKPLMKYSTKRFMKNMQNEELAERFNKMAAEYTEEDLNKDMDDFFKEGGIFDQHDVDNNDRITFDEFTKMNDDVAADFQKRYGEWPEYKGKEVKFVYRTHNKFSKGKGITKEDF